MTERPRWPRYVRLARAAGVVALLLMSLSVASFLYVALHHPEITSEVEDIYFAVLNPPVAKSLNGRMQAKVMQKVDLKDFRYWGAQMKGFGDFLADHEPTLMLTLQDYSSDEIRLVVADLGGKNSADVVAVPMPLDPLQRNVPPWDACTFVRPDGRDGVLALDFASGLLRLLEPATSELTWTISIPETQGAPDSGVATITSQGAVEAILVAVLSRGVIVLLTPEGEIAGRVPAAGTVHWTTGDFSGTGATNLLVMNLAGQFRIVDLQGNVLRTGRLDLLHLPMAIHFVRLEGGQPGVRVDYFELVAHYDLDGRLVEWPAVPILPGAATSSITVGYESPGVDVGNGMRLLYSYSMLALVDERGRVVDAIEDGDFEFVPLARGSRPGEVFVLAESERGHGLYLVRLTIK